MTVFACKAGILRNFCQQVMMARMAFNHNMYRLLRRWFIPLPGALPNASNHTYAITPGFPDKYNQNFRIQRIYQSQLLLMQPKHVHILSGQHRQWCSGTLYYASSNKLASAPRLNRIVIRSYHISSKFTVENPLYASYLNSLLEEHDMLTKSEPGSSATDHQQQEMLRLNFLKPVVEVIKRIHEKHSETQELIAATEVESDKDMTKLMEKEIENCKEAISELEEELVDALVGEDAGDHSDITLEVAAGVGGQEAMLFAAEMLRMYCNYAQYKGWSITGLTAEENEIGGIRRGIVEISGQDVYRHLKHEAGVHRVQRVPKTEKAGRIHTSTITVTVLPQPGEIDIDIKQKDLKIETFRNSGPGGQSVNTTDSAVRITHIPTGIVSEAKQERSQLRNRELAMKNLKAKIYQTILEEQELKYRATRKIQMGTRGRSEKIRTYNFQQDRITDHRLKESCSNLAMFMVGGEGLDDLVNLLHNLGKVQILESVLDEYESELTKKKSGKS